MSKTASVGSEVGLVSEPVYLPEQVRTPEETMLSIIERYATDAGFSVEKMEKMLDQIERMQALSARRAYTEAMAAFKACDVSISKSSRAQFATRGGGQMGYSYAGLDTVCNAVIPALSEQGLSHQWAEAQEGGRITVTCTLTHREGHSESVSLTAPTDDSGQKNPIQSIGSTVTYLRRYTLLGITGLAPGDDDDGHASHVSTRSEGSGRQDRANRQRTPTERRKAQERTQEQPPADAGSSTNDSDRELHVHHAVPASAEVMLAAAAAGPAIEELLAAIEARDDMHTEAFRVWATEAGAPEEPRARSAWYTAQLEEHGVDGMVEQAVAWYRDS